MFFSKLISKKSVVGVDIGTSFIKVAQLTHTGTAPVLDTYGLVDMSGQIEAGNKIKAVEQTAAILKQLLREAKVSASTCVASLPNAAVFTSVLDMPLMSDSDLASAMPFEAKKYVPLALSEMTLSWSVVSKDEQARTLKVLLIAVPTTIRESYLRLFQLAELDLSIIEIEALALIRSLAVSSESTHLIIDIGAKVTGLNVIRSGLLQLTRNLNVGGDTITDRIAISLNINHARAEQFKKDFGMSAKSAFVPESVKPVLNAIKSEAMQLISLYKSNNAPITGIILVGGSAALPGIVEYFADLGPEVTYGNPLVATSYPEAVKSALSRYQLQLPIAIGLALRTEGS